MGKKTMIKYTDEEINRNKKIPMFNLSEYLANFATQGRNLDNAIIQWFGISKKNVRKTKKEWDALIVKFFNIKEN